MFLRKATAYFTVHPSRSTIAVGMPVAEIPRTDPYVRIPAYGHLE